MSNPYAEDLRTEEWKLHHAWKEGFDARQAEIDALRQALAEIKGLANIVGDGNYADIYITIINEIHAIANSALL